MFLVLIYRDWKARAGVSSSLFAFLSVWPRLNYRTACFDRHGRIPISRRPFSCRRRREGEGWTGTERGGGAETTPPRMGFPGFCTSSFHGENAPASQSEPEHSFICLPYINLLSFVRERIELKPNESSGNVYTLRGLNPRIRISSASKLSSQSSLFLYRAIA